LVLELDGVQRVLGLLRLSDSGLGFLDFLFGLAEIDVRGDGQYDGHHHKQDEGHLKSLAFTGCHN